MSEADDFRSFFKENKKLVTDYFDTRAEIARLQGIRILSKSAGTLLWVILSMLFFSILLIFLGFVLGFWLSDLLSSYVAGFALTSLAIFIIIVLLALFRNPLFVNPIIRKLIKQANNEDDHSTR